MSWWTSTEFFCLWGLCFRVSWHSFTWSSAMCLEKGKEEKRWRVLFLNIYETPKPEPCTSRISLFSKSLWIHLSALTPPSPSPSDPPEPFISWRLCLSMFTYIRKCQKFARCHFMMVFLRLKETEVQQKTTGNLNGSQTPFFGGAVVVSQLVDRLLPTPEIGGSNPNIGKVLSTNCN